MVGDTRADTNVCGYESEAPDRRGVGHRFYHHGQRRFVVLELKIGEFDPEFAGKLNLYVNAVDEQLAQEHDNPTIGIVLCATRDESVTQLTLKGIASPIAASTYRLGKGATSTDLPDGLRQDLDEIKAVDVDLQTFASRRIRELEQAPERPDTPASRRRLRRVSAFRPPRAPVADLGPASPAQARPHRATIRPRTPKVTRKRSPGPRP